jgi:calcium/calmodulin-dependent protein kinase (CaM kinase) II
MTEDLLALNQRLLDAISAGAWDSYTELCDPALTCFEPETEGHLVEGMAFHKYYFDNGTAGAPRQETMVEPRVTMLGDDAACLTCVRLVQKKGADGQFATDRFSETRIWKKIGGSWKHVHFHRSCA